MSNSGDIFAQKIIEKGNLKPYDVRAIAKAYNMANKPQLALDIIAKLPDENMNHWILYRKAEALLALNDSTALDVINEALTLAIKDEKAKSNLASYHDLVRQCYEKDGNITQALIEAKNAIDNCDEGKYKRYLEKILLRLKSR